MVVSCTTTLHELKLRIFEALGVHPKNQLLYTARGQLEGEEVTLGQVRRRTAMELEKGVQTLGKAYSTFMDMKTRG